MSQSLNRRYTECRKGGRDGSSSLFAFGFQTVVLSAILLILPVLPALAESPLSGFNPATLKERRDSLFLDGATFWADNALPLQSIYFDRWGGPFKPDGINRSDNYWKIDAGGIYSGWRIAAFYRGELFVEANKDTVEILRMVNMKEDLPIGRAFDIDISAQGFSAAGVEISRVMTLVNKEDVLSAGFTVRYLRGEEIQEGRIEGNVISTGPKSYDFNLSLDYLYNENYIYNRRDVVAGTGDGYSADIGLRYTRRDYLSAEVLFRDIWGRIYWRDVPYTIAEATSDIKQFDEDGYQVYRPTIRGYEVYKDFTQEIPLKTDITVTYKRERLTLVPSINLIEDRPLYWINLNYRIKENLSLNTGYNVNYHAACLGVTYKRISLNIYSNDIDLRRAMAVGMTLSVNYGLR